MDRLKLILFPFAVYRLCRLIAYESGPFFVVDKLKSLTYKSKAIRKRQELAKSLDYLLSCPYCLGIWFSFLLYLFKVPFLIEVLGGAGIQSLLTTVDRVLEAKVGLLEKEKEIVQLTLDKEDTIPNPFPFGNTRIRK